MANPKISIRHDQINLEQILTDAGLEAELDRLMPDIRAQFGRLIAGETFDQTMSVLKNMKAKATPGARNAFIRKNAKKMERGISHEKEAELKSMFRRQLIEMRHKVASSDSPKDD